MPEERVEKETEKSMEEKKIPIHHAYGDCASSFREHNKGRGKQKKSVLKNQKGQCGRMPSGENH